MKKKQKNKLATTNNTQEVLQGEVVNGKDIERGDDKVKFNSEVQIISGFYQQQTGKVIGRKKVFIGEKMLFSYMVLLDSLDLVEIFEKEIKVLSDN